MSLSTNRTYKTETSTTSLDTTGFSVEKWPDLSVAARFAHADHIGTKNLMDLVVREAEPNEKRALRFRNCGSHVMLYMDPDTGDLQMRSNWCEARTCPRCSKTYGRNTALRFAQWLGYIAPHHWRFITLTLSHSVKPLVEQLQFIRESFRRLRQTEIWKGSQHYGKAIIEVTYNENTGTWHPHLHVISRGGFIAQGKLSAAWKRASNGSYVCDVREIQSGKHVANYVSKYVGKPPVVPDGVKKLTLFKEYYTALRNKKMIISYGKAPPLPDLKDCADPQNDNVNWQLLGSLNAIIIDSNNGCDFATGILQRLEKQRFEGREKILDNRAGPAP